MKGAGLLLGLLATAGCALADEPPVSDADTVFLRDFTVEATHVGWKYAAFQDYEILARCNRDAARNFARALAQSRSLEEELLPAGYLPDAGAPITALLYEDTGDFDSTLVPKPVRLVAGAREHQNGALRALAGFVEAIDADSFAICGNLAGAGDMAGFFNFDGGLMTFRLDRHRPRFPLWFTIGLLGPLGFADVVPVDGGLEFAKAAWISREQAVADIQSAGFLRPAVPAGSDASGVVTLDPYLVEAKTRLLLLPLGEIFRIRHAGEPPPSKLWQAEAGLFLRWCFLEGRGRSKHLKELQKLLDRSLRGRLSEDDFRASFGFGYAEMEEKLATYLFGAEKATERIEFQRPWPPALQVHFRTATDVEVARIVGNWERMRGEAVRGSNSALRKRYLERAEASLQRAYDSGSRDPQLLAVFGLVKRDIGDIAGARVLLEAATAAKVRRPAAYITLANLRLAEAQSHPQADNGRFSPQQVIDILKPIFTAREQAVLPYYAYGAIADAWYRSATKPNLAHLQALQEGIDYYPRDAQLAYVAARVSSRWGYPELTAAFTQAGMRFADDDMAAKLAAVPR